VSGAAAPETPFTPMQAMYIARLRRLVRLNVMLGDDEAHAVIGKMIFGTYAMLCDLGLSSLGRRIIKGERE
jgi:hypothetical protein